jgi:hypothetical protein
MQLLSHVLMVHARIEMVDLTPWLKKDQEYLFGDYEEIMKRL